MRATRRRQRLTTTQQSLNKHPTRQCIPNFTSIYPKPPAHVQMKQKHEKIKKYHFSLDTFPT